MENFKSSKVEYIQGVRSKDGLFSHVAPKCGFQILKLWQYTSRTVIYLTFLFSLGIRWRQRKKIKKIQNKSL